MGYKARISVHSGFSFLSLIENDPISKPMKPFALLFLAFVFPLVACGGNDEPEESTAIASMQDAAQNLESMAEEMERRAEQPPAEPVDFQNLKNLLPEQLAGFSRTEASGRRQQMGQAIGYSEATASYSNGVGSVDVEIMDMGGASAFAMLGLGWAMVEMEEETDTGYKRTREIEGYRGYEEYDSEVRRGEMSVMVADRFMVKVAGRDVDMDVIEQAITSIDLDALEDMKDEGREDA